MMEKESLAAEIGELSSELAKYKGENFDYKVYVQYLLSFQIHLYIIGTCTVLHVCTQIPSPLYKKFLVEIRYLRTHERKLGG